MGHGEITWAPMGNHVGPHGKSRGPPWAITWALWGSSIHGIFQARVLEWVAPHPSLVTLAILPQSILHGESNTKCLFAHIEFNNGEVYC